MPFVDKLMIFGGQNTCVVHPTTRKLDGNMWIVSTLNIKRAARHLESQLFVAIIGEVDEGGVGTPLLPSISNMLDEFADQILDSLPKFL